MTFVSNPTIGVVGAGASGVLAAASILRALRRPARVVLFDGRGSRGAGLAYGTADPDHILNVPAARMSAVADEPDDFVRWMREQGAAEAETWRVPATPEAFVPRGLYARYLEDVLRTSLERSHPGVVLEVHAEEIDDLVRRGAGWRLHGRSGAAWIANVVVLALGYRPPTLPREIAAALGGHPRYLPDPWQPRAFEAIPPEDLVLVLGAHLTMVDVALTLDRRAHRGGIVAVSPRGLLPLSHGPGDPGYVASGLDAPPVTIRGLLHRARQAAAAEEAAGGSWRSVADAIRSMAPRLWSAMDERERARFLRHVQPYWEIHRHRMAPAIAMHVGEMRSEGRLRLMAGRVVSLSPHAAGFTVEIRRRGSGGAESVHAGWIVNATGPTIRYGDDPTVLLRRLFESGVARPGPHGLGLDATRGGALLNSSGETHGDLFTLGPPLRGILWESTAVPEIRLQAADLARSLTGVMGLDRA